MKSIPVKFAAIVLAALSLLIAVGSVMGLIGSVEMGLEHSDAKTVWEEELKNQAYAYAYSQAEQYATYSYSTAPISVLDAANGRYYSIAGYQFPSGIAVSSYQILLDGTVVSGTESNSGGSGVQTFRFSIQPRYTLAQSSDQKAPENASYQGTYRTEGKSYSFYEMNDRNFQVEVSLFVSENSTEWVAISALDAVKNYLPVTLVLGLLLFAASISYLCWAAGKKKGSTDIFPAGLNALPLDLYGGALQLLADGCIVLVCTLLEYLSYREFSLFLTVVVVLLAYGICLILVAFGFALVAQLKAKGHYLWRNSMVGRVLGILWRLCKRGAKAAGAFLRMLPVIWQWVLTAAAMVLIPLIFLIFGWNKNGFHIIPFFFTLLLDGLLVLYGGWCFGHILKATKKMAGGDLQSKIPTQNLYGAFKTCAEELNCVSDAAAVAAREQLKSERMKTELITNVSHDIKTPLTSIINYVDLLQKPHSEAEQTQYLEVLSRQSGRLKKLIEDLTEMSKASSGNITPQITRLDAAESVRQALGEFADKLAARQITPIFCPPEEPVFLQADGRLTWRVMSNLLGNAVKYALPGTRLYVNLEKEENRVQISLKNISAEPLNISAEELMERFVRGDVSRNTEGSGLGLSIARELMEVQNGSLQLLVDGDLFKVTLFFPCS